MKITRSYLYRVLIFFLGPASLLILLYFLDSSNSIFSEKQQFAFINIMWASILAYLTYEMINDIVKKQYSASKYIIITEMIGIITLITLWFIDFNDSMAKQGYMLAAMITFAITLLSRRFLKIEKFDKNKEIM